MRATTLVLLAVAVVAAGCGVTTQTEARTTDPADVPFGLAEQTPRSPPDMALPPGGPVAEVYFLDADGRLVGVSRRVAGEGPAEVIGALLAGPTATEADAGVATAIPDEETVVAVDVVGGVAVVDLAAEFSDLGGGDQRSALAQLVYTLTARPGIGRVSFTLEGQPVEVPRGDGTLTTGSVSRDSYREMRPIS